jgi:low affinity Fe/Cu permease
MTSAVTAGTRRRRGLAQRTGTSGAVHVLHELTARPTIAVVAAIVVGIAWVVIVATGFDSDLELVFGNLCASVTVVMVFVLQHTERRERLALQLKLDELLHASPKTEERLVAVEEASDEELSDLDERRLGQHRAARE